tara:strand:- start:476 stop:628 length:153 start_codon:yes stop_codon:yes gene_type:complete
MSQRFELNSLKKDASSPTSQEAFQAKGSWEVGFSHLASRAVLKFGIKNFF